MAGGNSFDAPPAVKRGRDRRVLVGDRRAARGRRTPGCYAAPAMRWCLRVASAIDEVNRRLGRGVAWLTLWMVLVGAYNAIARSFERELGLRLSSNALLELQWYLFSLVFLLGAPWALRAGAHVRVDVIYGGHSVRGRAWIDLVGGLVLLAPFCVFAIQVSWPFVVDSWREGEMSNDPGGLPRWPLKPFVPLAFALLLAQGISEVIKRIAILRGMSSEEVGLEEPRADGEGAI